MSGADRSVRTTSWGAAWIESLVLARTFEGTELSRGRGIAARGAVDEFLIEPASVSGVVRGRSSLERRVRIGFRRLDDLQWELVRSTLAGSSRVLAAVLDGDLSAALHARLVESGCGLMPGVRDVSIDCTCGNLAESCVHAAAVCCRLADELDRDPLLLVTLRGGDRSALVAGMAPRPSATDPGGHRDARRRSSVIPGRPDDPTVGAAAAWRRRPADLPLVERRRRGAGRPRIGATAPSAELGFDQAGLDRLVRDAAARAEAVLAHVDGTGAADGDTAQDACGLAFDEVTDAIRRCAAGTLAPSIVARVAGCAPDDVPSLTAAWSRAGADGVEVLLHPRRLTEVEVEQVEAAFECEVRTRSTGALLPDGRHVRRAADAAWVLVEPDELVGWRVVDLADGLDDLAAD